MPGEFAVIGLGQFGRAVAHNLARQGQPVLAVDADLERVEAIKDEVDAAICADATDEEALHGLRLEAVSCVVVAIGAHSTEASIMTTALVSQMGVPRIIARASDELHSRILRSVGAHEVIDPEQEMGLRLARRLSHPSIVDQISLGDSVIGEVEAPEAFAGQSLSDLNIRQDYHVSVMAIRSDDAVNANPKPDDTIDTGDILIVLGDQEAVDRLAALA